MARPGGNATGVNIFTAELTAKRLDLLREFVPGAARVGLLVNPANATSTESTLRDNRGEGHMAITVARRDIITLPVARPPAAAWPCASNRLRAGTGRPQ